MAAYRRVYDSRQLQTDCQEPGSAPEPYARQSSIVYLYVYFTLASVACALLAETRLFVEQQHRTSLATIIYSRCQWRARML